ncbi:class I SAM-dependent methyltransferase [Flavivirga spongiicola]|uniref:Class I SAM-dependent methyltransferase n=1 Tax=Flavivirga spongiicola TaxID=421621 RepID=A0ABU7XNH9_9FLAO|nr:class I SAM-dependent methyltransferase [Flavivirga sp. MEBiC05379]MDO5977322.1 class I SAM-dependent methyltransferase [Flavivirga sp. MEBiC05379]
MKRENNGGNKKIIKKYFFQQFQKPTGYIGSLIGKLMNIKNSERINYTIEKVNPIELETILEIGYGSGLAINRICEKSDPQLVFGVDHSEIMHKQACKLNKKYIDKNKVRLYCCELEDIINELPWFDTIFLSNVHLFWNNPVKKFILINSLLEPHGDFILTYQPHEAKNEAQIKKIAKEIAIQLKEAGFSYIGIEYKKMKPVTCIAITASMEDN